MISKQLQHRLLFSTVAIAILIISIYYSHHLFFRPVFVLFNCAIISYTLQEYYHLAKNKGFTPSLFLALGTSFFYIIALELSLLKYVSEALPSLILLIAFLMLFLNKFNQTSSALGNLAVNIFGICYVTIPLSCVLRINDFFPPGALEDGRLWLSYTLIVSKITDVGAYFCGKMIGKAKLAPSISPKKTIAGAIGGTSVAVTTSILFVWITSYFSSSFHMTWGQSIWIGFSISILAQLGDLSESLLKRDAGVKDSNQLPGVGGMLDLVDSLVFTLPFVYLLLWMEAV